MSPARWAPTSARHVHGESGALDRILGDVEALLVNSGVSTALGFLNARTRFRFSGVYRADPPLLRNVCLYDRENPRLSVSGEVSRLDETYCGITCGTGEPFVTPDAPNDDRLRGHAARAAVLSYGGVPLCVDGGPPWGALCHFDVRPRLLPADELAVLEAVAPLFARWASGRQDLH